jgi:hypothetical protein
LDEPVVIPDTIDVASKPSSGVIETPLLSAFASLFRRPIEDYNDRIVVPIHELDSVQVVTSSDATKGMHIEKINLARI